MPVGTWHDPTKGLATKRQYEYTPAYSEGPVILTDYRVMS